MDRPSGSRTKGGKAEGLAASLHFTDSSGSKLLIEKTYWLDQLENHVSMSVGSTKYILIGVIDGATFCIYGNKYEDDPRQKAENKEALYLTIGTSLAFSSDLIVTIQVYSVDTGKVFDTQTFHIPHDDEIVNTAKKEPLWMSRFLKDQKR